MSRSSSHSRGALAAVAAALVFSAGIVPASAKEPSLPKCTGFSVKAITALLGVGHMYFDKSLAHGSSCSYYGVPASQANSYPKSVPAASQIHYIPALQITLLAGNGVLYHYEEGLLDREADEQKLSYGGVPPSVGLPSKAKVYHGVLSSADLPACEEGLEYNNWTGPPICREEPSMEKIWVLAYGGPKQGPGLVVSVSAAAQYPGRLTQSHLELLTKDALAGHIP